MRFAYDANGRMVKASLEKQPNTLSVYDANGNLKLKIDARSITTTFGYDALNRVAIRDYSDSTADVSYTYDDEAIPNSKGKLTKVSNSFSETRYTQFDIIGRLLSSQQITDGQTYISGYVYNLSGALIEETYPSGRVVKNTLDTDGSLQQVQSKKVNDTFKNYANSFNYTAAGAVSSMRLGNGRWENTSFNARLQPTQIGLGASATNQSLLKLNYDYGTTDNNGNVKSQTITVQRSNQSPLVLTQSYVYDSLNRLKSSEEKDATNQTTWKQTYTFDRYGNRRFDQANTSFPASFANPNATNPNIDTANNRFTTGQGYTY
jgi:YD repeat-containing protein